MAVLLFAFGFVLAPVLRVLVAQSLPEEGEAPWDAGSQWKQGYCPVCGSFASIGWLDKPMLDEKNAYLAGGGGKVFALRCVEDGARGVDDDGAAT